MKIYSEDELEKIKKTKETNDKLEDLFSKKRDSWNKAVSPLFKSLSFDLEQRSHSKILIDSQATALSYRQELSDQINLFLNKRSKESIKLKRIKQDKFIFYATGFGIKTNLGEKSLLIDAHLAENERTVELIDSYIEFLRDTVKGLENFGYSVKNIIALLNYLGK